MEVKFEHDASPVAFHGPRADVENGPNFFIRFATRQKMEDLPLPWARTAGSRVIALARLWIDGRGCTGIIQGLWTNERFLWTVCAHEQRMSHQHRSQLHLRRIKSERQRGPEKRYGAIDKLESPRRQRRKFFLYKIGFAPHVGAEFISEPGELQFYQVTQRALADMVEALQQAAVILKMEFTDIQGSGRETLAKCEKVLLRMRSVRTMELPLY